MWFRKEVLSHRCAWSLICSLILQEIFINGFILFLKVFSQHPLAGFIDWFHFIFNYKSLLCRLVLCMTTVIFIISHIHNCDVRRTVFTCRAQMIQIWFNPFRLLCVITLSTLAVINTYCYLYLTKLSNSQGHASYLAQRFSLNSWQEIIFLLGHGLFMGILFCFFYFTNEWNILQFSLEEQPKYLFLGKKVKEFVKNSFHLVFKAFHYYYIIFILSGYVVLNWSSINFNTDIGLNFVSLCYNLLNVNLVITTIMTGVFLQFIWSIMLHVFSIFMTERYEFMIDTTSKEYIDKTLIKMLIFPPVSISHYLAVEDLRWLAEFSPERRKKFFSISYPGGHPNHWNCVSNFSLKVLQNLLENLQKLSIPKFNNNSVTQPKPQNDVCLLPELIQNYFKEKRIYKYLFDEFLNLDSLIVFSQCQLEIWVIEALCFFIVASLAEDNYGVVQTSLPQILQQLIDLKLCFEKISIRYGDGIKCYIISSQKFKLKSAIDNTLISIARTFQEDIKQIFLPEHYKRQLEQYLNFKR